MENQTVKVVFAKSERISVVVQTSRGPKLRRGSITELDSTNQRVRILRDESQTEESFEMKDIRAVELLSNFLSDASVHAASRFYNDGNGNFSMHDPFDNPPPTIKPGPQNVSDSQIIKYNGLMLGEIVIGSSGFNGFSSFESIPYESVAALELDVSALALLIRR